MRSSVSAPAPAPAPPAQPSFLTECIRVITLWAQRAIDARFDVQVLANPEIFAGLSPPSATPLTPGTGNTVGTGVKIYQNVFPFPVICHVRLETYGTGTTAVLAADLELVRVTKADARWVREGAMPTLAVLLPPNRTLFAACTDSSGGNQTTFNAIVVPIPLNGRRGALGGITAFPVDLAEAKQLPKGEKRTS